MRVKMTLQSLKETTLKEYTIRFVLGGCVTVIIGLIAKQFGPGIGGLFLAFPAIFCSSATLVESHEKEKKQSFGMSGAARGRNVAALEARGAALGAIGLFAFAGIISLFLPRHRPWLVLCEAAGVWLSVAMFAWWLPRSRPGM
jgi:hypothetical protein